MANPIVSVLMAVHNGMPHLPLAIESIQQQTFADWEMIVVDDGSTDESANCIAKYAVADRRIHLVRQSNQGLTPSLNHASKLARGSFLARMDADDVAMPTRFEQQVAFLCNHSDVIAAGAGLLLIDPDGDPLGTQVVSADHDQIIQQLFQGQGALPHPTAMMVAEAFEQVGGYDESFTKAQDLDLWLRLSAIGKLANLSEPLLQYRLHVNSITSRHRSEQLECARRAVAAAYQRIGQDVPLLSHLSDRGQTASQVYRRWARMALKSGFVDVARKHAWNGIKASPWSLSHVGIVAKLMGHALSPSASLSPPNSDATAQAARAA
ncbi:Putative glycosyltransferase EpsE [Stieleria bergensis]|uniref:Glycosyltransferase EpsE n=1 Tax=Stieleria bergensis TaxID=2528025 RepID=A0A517SP43_9BACT|nr:Putative glycosyltransferase EpsE [Planctomycetes bacterium SV_7m_r]